MAKTVQDQMIAALADRLALCMVKANNEAVESFLAGDDELGKWFDEFVEGLLRVDEASVRDQARWRSDIQYNQAKARVKDFLRDVLRQRRRRDGVAVTAQSATESRPGSRLVD